MASPVFTTIVKYGPSDLPEPRPDILLDFLLIPKMSLDWSLLAQVSQETWDALSTIRPAKPFKQFVFVAKKLSCCYRSKNNLGFVFFVGGGWGVGGRRPNFNDHKNGGGSVGQFLTIIKNRKDHQFRTYNFYWKITSRLKRSFFPRSGSLHFMVSSVSDMFSASSSFVLYRKPMQQQASNKHFPIS